MHSVIHSALLKRSTKSSKGSVFLIGLIVNYGAEILNQAGTSSRAIRGKFSLFLPITSAGVMGEISRS